MTGHIGGTPTREMLESTENRRDLSGRSGGVAGASTEIRDAHSQDPAYRPADLP